MRLASRIKLLRMQLERALWRRDRSPRILIVGCGRSGTNYVANLLTSMGFPFSHEGFPKKGIAAWPLTVRDSGPMPWWMLCRRDDFTFTPVLHQVRNPISVIASTQTFARSSWDYIKRHIPLDDRDSLLLKSMKYWYYWNLKAEETAEWTYRIESFSEVFPEFCEQIGHPELIRRKGMLQRMARNVNTRAALLKRDPSKLPREKVTWSRLEGEDKELCARIRALAGKYGYAD